MSFIYKSKKINNKYINITTRYLFVLFIFLFSYNFSSASETATITYPICNSTAIGINANIAGGVYFAKDMNNSIMTKIVFIDHHLMRTVDFSDNTPNLNIYDINSRLVATGQGGGNIYAACTPAGTLLNHSCSGTTYTETYADGHGGTYTNTINNSPNCGYGTKVSFTTPTSQTLNYNATTSLVWNIIDAIPSQTQCFINGPIKTYDETVWTTNLGPGDTEIFKSIDNQGNNILDTLIAGPIQNDTNYILHCSGTSETSANTSIVVTPPSITSFTISTTTVGASGIVKLSWNSQSTKGCTLIDGFSKTTKTVHTSENDYQSGQATSSDSKSTATFMLTCAGGNNTSVSSSPIDVNIKPKSLTVTDNVTASPSSVFRGGTSKIEWTSTNADSCVLRKDGSRWIPIAGASGSTTTSPLTATTVVDLDCKNNGDGERPASETITSSATINVSDRNQPFITLDANQTEISWQAQADYSSCNLQIGDGPIQLVTNTSSIPSDGIEEGTPITLTCSTASGISSSITKTSLPPAVSSACSHMQGSDSKNVYLNRSTVWSVKITDLSNVKMNTLSTVWNGTDMATDTQGNPINITKIYTTVGEKNISAKTVGKRIDGSAFISRCTSNITVKTDSGTNHEI